MDDSKTLQKAENEIDKLGFPIPDKPALSVDSVEWPNNVGDLSPDALAEHMTWWSGWAAYARHHLARAETNATAFDKEKRLMESERIHKSEGDYKNVTELKAAVAQMPDMQVIEAKHLEADAVKKMVKALLEGYESKYATISREISRRGFDFSESGDRYKA